MVPDPKPLAECAESVGCALRTTSGAYAYSPMPCFSVLPILFSPGRRAARVSGIPDSTPFHEKLYISTGTEVPWSPIHRALCCEPDA
jgi:hypothetical protein